MTNGRTFSIPASYYSQVSHLFVARGTHIWGTFDEMANVLQFHDSPDEQLAARKAVDES